MRCFFFARGLGTRPMFWACVCPAQSENCWCAMPCHAGGGRLVQGWCVSIQYFCARTRPRSSISIVASVRWTASFFFDVDYYHKFVERAWIWLHLTYLRQRAAAGTRLYINRSRSFLAQTPPPTHNVPLCSNRAVATELA